MNGKPQGMSTIRCLNKWIHPASCTWRQRGGHILPWQTIVAEGFFACKTGETRHSVRLRHSMVQPGHWCCVFLLFVVTGSGRFWVLPKKWHHTALHSCSCQRGLQRMRLWKRPPWGFWLVWPKFTFSFRFSLRFGGDAASCRRRTPGTKLPEWGRVVLITCGRAYSCSK